MHKSCRGLFFTSQSISGTLRLSVRLLSVRLSVFLTVMIDEPCSQRSQANSEKLRVTGNITKLARKMKKGNRHFYIDFSTK